MQSAPHDTLVVVLAFLDTTGRAVFRSTCRTARDLPAPPGS